MMTPPSLQEQIVSESRHGDSRKGPHDRTRYAIHVLHGIARFLLLTSICVAPWCLGGVEPDVQVVLYAAVLSSLFVWCVAAGITQLTLGLSPIRLPPVILPLIGVLLLGTHQLRATSSASIAELAKPKAITAASEVAAMDSNAWSTESTTGTGPNSTLSATSSNQSASLLMKLLPQNYSHNTIAAGLTRFEVARYSMAVVAVFLGVVLFQSHSSQIWLWGALAVNGAALSVFGILESLTWNGRLYWWIPISLGGEPFASFVNRRNAAGYLSLTLACAAGVMFWACCRRQWIESVKKIVDDGLRKGSRRIQRRFSRIASKILLSIDRHQILSALIAALIFAGIISSRCGLLATTVAAATCLFLIFRLRGELRSLPVVAIELGLFIIGLVICIALVGNAAESSAGSSRRNDLQAHWHDALKVVDDFPATGAGLGTYRYAYLPYQSRESTHWFTHADNQFVEILVETGVVGISLTVLLILVSLSSTLALSRNQSRPVDDPAGIVGTFAVISQAINACFDFGATLPATMLTIAVILGAVTGRGARLADNEDPKSWWLACPGLRPAWMILLLGMAFLTHGVFAWREVLAAAETRTAYRGLPARLDAPDSMSLEELNHAIQRLTSAAARRPDDAEAHRTLGELWVYRYRLAALNELRRHSNDADVDWGRTHLSSLYAMVNSWKTNVQSQRLNDLRESSHVAENLINARHHFAVAQQVSPLLPGVDLPLAMLEFLDPAGASNGIEHLERALVLTPTDPETLEFAATLAEAAGLPEFAYGCWRRELILKPNELQRIATHLAGKIGIQEQLASVIPNSPEAFIELADSVYAGPEHEETRRLLLTKAVQSLAEVQLTDQFDMLTTGYGLHLMARARKSLGEYDSAVYFYRQALTLEPLQLEWRLELVDVLKSQGRLGLALKQAELCLSLDPQRTKTKELIEELRRQSDSQESSKKSGE